MIGRGPEPSSSAVSILAHYLVLNFALPSPHRISSPESTVPRTSRDGPRVPPYRIISGTRLRQACPTVRSTFHPGVGTH
eukprot:760558-Hanusia_phi.AAC.1